MKVVEKKLVQLVKHFPQIKLLYLFGSRARADFHPTSDYDFAIYFDKCSEQVMFTVKQTLQIQFCRLLNTNHVDIVVLNTVHNSEMKYHIITEGKLLLQNQGYATMIEPKIMNEYIDFHDSLLRYQLTVA